MAELSLLLNGLTTLGVLLTAGVVTHYGREAKRTVRRSRENETRSERNKKRVDQLEEDVEEVEERSKRNQRWLAGTASTEGVIERIDSVEND